MAWVRRCWNCCDAKMTLRILIPLWLLASSLAAETKPNILLIMVDDLGWTDLHCQGNARLSTPNIDRLAGQGMRFTDAYAAAPVCSPTRAAVLTGQSPARLRITNHIPDRPGFARKDAVLVSAPMLDHLPTEAVTIAELLKKSGYATAFFGKWHLAGESRGKDGLGDLQFYPEQQGFDINLGGCALGGPPSYSDPFRIHNLPPRQTGDYLPDRLADELIHFLRGNRTGPFLAFLWNYTVHWPMEAPEPLVKKYRDRTDLGRLDPRYAAMIEALDSSVGRVLSALDELNLTKDTLVVFTSDNGAFGGVSDLAPLREAKGYLYEGGLRVPLLARWPGVIPPGTVCGEPVISMDFFPTFLEAAGLPPPTEPSSEGESLLPLFRQSGLLQRGEIFFHYPHFAFHGSNRPGSAMRQGHFKLIENFDDGSLELYDLKEDLGETRNLAPELPQQAESMRQQLQAWRDETRAALPTRR